MSEKKPEEAHETDRRITIRWKVMQALGGMLIVLGIFVDWPPPSETGLPDTSSFLIILGGLLGVAGLLAALRKK
jgi:LPXTG-motif cell wall-anchored protein